MPKKLGEWQTLIAAVSVSISLLGFGVMFLSGCIYAGNRILILAYAVGGAMNQHQQIIDAQIKAQQRQDEIFRLTQQRQDETFRLIADKCK